MAGDFVRIVTHVRDIEKQEKRYYKEGDLFSVGEDIYILSNNEFKKITGNSGSGGGETPSKVVELSQVKYDGFYVRGYVWGKVLDLKIYGTPYNENGFTLNGGEAFLDFSNDPELVEFKPYWDKVMQTNQLMGYVSTFSTEDTSVTSIENVPFWSDPQGIKLSLHMIEGITIKRNQELVLNQTFIMNLPDMEG